MNCPHNSHLPGRLHFCAAALACLAAFLAGCAPADTKPRESDPAVQLLYQSQGEIVAVKTFGPVGEEQVLIWEGFEADDTFMEPRSVLRVFRLDPSTGKTQVEWETASSDTLSGWGGDGLAVSPDGRRFAQIESHFDYFDYFDYSDLDPARWRVWVGDAGGVWTPVTPWATHMPFLPQWSPDGDVLAYLSFQFEESMDVAVVAVGVAVPRPPGLAEETILTPQGYRSSTLAWASDSQRLYHTVYGGDPPVHALDVVDWPSLERHRLMTAKGLGSLSLARRSRDVVFTQEVEATGEPEDVDTNGEQTADAVPTFAVWRLSPDGKLEKTPVQHTGRLLYNAVAVSPDGERLAVVPMAEGTRPEARRGDGLVIYTLKDGAAHSLQDLEGKSVQSVDWALGGRGLLVTEDSKTVWLVTVQGDAPEIGPAGLEAPLISSFPPDPAQQSRNNLRALVTALRMYMGDHDCLFPDLSNLDALREVLANYVEDDDVFLDLRTKQPYGVNSSFSGSCPLDVEDIFDRVVFYETAPGEDGGRNVALIDGHATHVSADEWRQLKKLSGID